MTPLMIKFFSAGHSLLASLYMMPASIMYMIDTGAHFLLPNYDTYSEVFLAMVAIPSIIGEMSFAIWLLVKGGKT